MIGLGFWQVHRGEAKQALIDGFSNGAQLTLEEAVRTGARYARISTTGRFDTQRSILLDNVVLAGRVGVHVFTPFQTFSGETILVNRGWKPMAADRRSLPEVWTPAVPLGIRGILAPPPAQGRRLGSADDLSGDAWPKLVTYLDIPSVAAAIDTDLPDWIVWLDSDDPSGFEGRHWSPVVMTPERHRAYAVQWFALAVAALIIWVVLAVRARKGQDGSVSE